MQPVQMLKILGEVNNMQLGIENDLRPIGQDLVSVIRELHQKEIESKDEQIKQKNLVIEYLLNKNKELLEKLRGVN